MKSDMVFLFRLSVSVVHGELIHNECFLNLSICY